MNVFRSGTLSMYDFADGSGLRHWGAVRPTCGVSAIPALGMLLAGATSVQCKCAFNFHGSLALGPARRRSNEDWALFPHTGALKGPVKQAILNLGAPGDRRDQTGKLWLAFPRSASKPHRGKVPYTLQVPVKIQAAEGMGPNRVHGDRVKITGTERPWIYASQVRGPKTITVNLNSKAARAFTVRLHFCELDDTKPGQRVFDVKIQGKVVAKGLDVVKETGGRYKALVKEYKGVRAGESLSVAPSG